MTLQKEKGKVYLYSIKQKLERKDAMKIKRIGFLKGLLVVAFVAASFLVLNAGSTFAATRTWTGGGGDNNLATAGNWQGDTAPQDGDTLNFSESEETLTVNNNLSTSIEIDGITAQRSVIIEGAALKLKGSISGEGDYISFKNDIEVTEDLSVGLSFLMMEGNISGSGNITHTYSGEYGQWYLNSTSSNSGYTGSISANGIQLCALSIPGILGTGGTHSITDGSLLFQDVSANVTISANLELSNSTLHTTGGLCGTGAAGGTDKSPYTVTLSGDIAVTPPVSFLGIADLAINGTVSGGSITVQSGSLGDLIINGQTEEASQQIITWNSSGDCTSFPGASANTKYIVNAQCPSSVFHTVFGILSGTGRVGEVSIVSGGRIAPGNSPGTLSTGDLTFEEGGIYEFEVAGNGAGEYDQINVTGTVALGNGTLQVVPLNNFVPTQGQSFVIINNDGSDAVTGTFAGLAQGATVEVNGQPMFTISYTGGDGNDVVLTAIPGAGNAGAVSNSSRTGFLALGALSAFGILVKARPLITRIRR